MTSEPSVSAIVYKGLLPATNKLRLPMTSGPSVQIAHACLYETVRKDCTLDMSGKARFRLPMHFQSQLSESTLTKPKQQHNRPATMKLSPAHCLLLLAAAASLLQTYYAQPITGKNGCLWTASQNGLRLSLIHGRNSTATRLGKFR